MKRLLIVSTSAGSGHTRAAQALEGAARELHPEAEVKHVDILDLTSPLYKKAYAGTYLKMVNDTPALWGYVYHATNRPRRRGADGKLVRMFDRVQFAGFRSLVRDFEPDVLLATHFLPAKVLAPSRRKGRDRFPVAVTVTDFDVHSLWVEPTVDRYLVGSGEVRALLAGRGIDEAKITVTGIPIDLRFARRLDRAKIRAGLGLSSERPVVLIMSGGAGVGAMSETVRVALECAPVQVLVVAGRNEELRRRLERQPTPREATLSVFGFVDTIDELMAASDVAVTKSGGLTSSECLATALPMIVLDPIPGQEERNCDYLVESGAAVKALGVDALRYKLRLLLSEPTRRQRMSDAARAAARPHAALDVVEAACALVGAGA